MTKYWTTVSIALLGLVGGGALTANAANVPARQKSNHNNQSNSYQLNSNQATSGQAKATLVNDHAAPSLSNNTNSGSSSSSSSSASFMDNDDLYMKILQNHIGDPLNSSEGSVGVSSASNSSNGDDLNNFISASSNSESSQGSFADTELDNQDNRKLELSTSESISNAISKTSSALRSANVLNSEDINYISKRQGSLFKMINQNQDNPASVNDHDKVTASDNHSADNPASQSSSSRRMNNFNYHLNSVNASIGTNNTEQNPEASNINPIITDDDHRHNSGDNDNSDEANDNHEGAELKGSANHGSNNDESKNLSSTQNSLISKRLTNLNSNVSSLNNTVNNLSNTVEKLLQNLNRK